MTAVPSPNLSDETPAPGRMQTLRRDVLLCAALAALGTAASYLSVPIPNTPIIIEGRWAFGFMGFAMLSRRWLAVVLLCVLSICHFTWVLPEASVVMNVGIIFFGNMLYATPAMIAIRLLDHKLLRRLDSLVLYAAAWFVMILGVYVVFNTPLLFGLLAFLDNEPILPAVWDAWRTQPYAVEALLVGLVTALGAAVFRSHMQLKANEDELATTLNSIGDAVIATDLDGRITRMNPVAETLTGWSQTEAAGQPLGDVFRIVNEHTGVVMESPVDIVLREQRVVGLANGTALIARNGQRRIIADSGSPIRWADGTITGVVLVFRDQTDQREARQQLEFQAQVLDQIEDCVTATDMDGRITYVNEAVARILGRSRDTLLGRPVTTFGDDPAEGATQAEIMQATRQQGEWVGEVVNVAEDGARTTLECRTRLLTDAEGRAVGMVGISTNITDRKEALESLEQANRIIEASPAAAITWRNEAGWPVEFASPGIVRITGYSLDELQAESFCFDALIHPDDLPRVIDEVAAATRNPKAREVNNQPYRLIDRVGNTHWIEDATTIRRNAVGEITHYDGVLLDITERKRAEEAYKRVCDVASEMICAADIHTATFIECNPAFERVLGYSRDELLGQSFLNFIHPDDVEMTQAVISEQLAAGAAVLNFENRYRCKDGTYRYFEWNSHPITEEGITYAIAHDITERKHREEQLRESEQRFRSFVENANDIVYALSPEGVFTYVSPNWLEFMGEPADAAVGKSFAPYVLDEDVHLCEAFLKDVLARREQLESVEYRVHHKDGSIHWHVSRGSPLTDENGQIIGYVGIARDTTAEKQAEKEREVLESQLRQAGKMEAVGRLAGGVAHDFNNMLQTILGYTDMILQTAAPDSDLHDQLVEIRNAATRSADLTRQLLAFARKQNITPKVVDINDMTSKALKMLGRLIGEDIDLQWLPGKAWPVKIDPTQFDRILANLVVNARDAITGTGRVTIETGQTTIDEAYCEDHPGFQPGAFTTLAVSDNGHGMEPETAAQIFEPFFTTKAQGQGTGLGLATVYGVVKQNGGFINVYSEPGLGTTIRVYLARTDREEHSDTAETLPAQAGRGSETILLVEDEAALLKLSQRLLTELGYTVLAANGPRQAIELAREQNGKIDLLLTDVVMPDMSGRDLWRHLRHEYPSLKCVFMSGYTANVIAEHGVLEEGVNFLQKPFASLEMQSKLRDVLDNGD